MNVERDGLDALRYSTPADVVRAHHALERFSFPDPLPSSEAARAAGVYHGRHFGTDFLTPDLLHQAVRSLKAFYAAAASEGEATFHSIG